MAHVTIASIPRCGSTYLLRSIAGLPQGPYTPKDIKRHRITKVHSAAAAAEAVQGRVVFLFGDIVTAVASTAQHRLDAGHFRNCGAPWPPEDDIRDRDILGYERMWSDWTLNPPIFHLLAVRYDTMATEKGRRAIEEWTGRRITWLPWQKRRDTNVTPEDRARIERAYASLIQSVRQAPDIFVVRTFAGGEEAV